jgi:predicted amidophosphoribosyltransferase
MKPIVWKRGLALLLSVLVLAGVAYAAQNATGAAASSAAEQPIDPWLVVIIIVVIAAIIYLWYTRSRPTEEKIGHYSGIDEANRVIIGYKHPCRYCGKLIPPNSNVCPFCAKDNPLGPLRCPRCMNPIDKEWKKCSGCGQELSVQCPECGEKTFFADYCEKCGARLVVKCPGCLKEQPPLGDNCIKCGKPLPKREFNKKS